MKYVTAITALMLSATIASADGYANKTQKYAVITDVRPVYIDQYVEVYDTQCRNVEVPVYGTVRGGSNGDVLAGAVIGGAIGNQFGNGSGKDAMTVLGAILGANSGSNSKRQVITGYTIETQCEKVKVIVNEPVLSHYNIKYVLDGVKYRQETTRHYSVGERVKVSVSLN